MIASALAAVLSACAPPDPGERRVLVISDQGAYTFDGTPVAREQIRSAIALQQQRSGQRLFAEIVASPKADMAVVQEAVDALKAEKARFAFIDQNVLQRKVAPPPKGNEPEPAGN